MHPMCRLTNCNVYAILAMINPSFGKSFLFLLLSRAAMHQNFVFISLFFRLAPRRDSRVLAEKERSAADNFLQKQQKQQNQRSAADAGCVNRRLAGRSRSVIIRRLAIAPVHP